MKPFHGDLMSRSCSCTSCFYKSESDKPSIRHMHGSRIDKIYLGKYIPMREQKLLDKLVRTRAVYDDIRKQLLSDTNVNHDAKSLKTKLGSKDLDDREDKSSSIIKLVNLVDKGEVGQTSLSECCSCCSCDSKLRLQDQEAEVYRDRHSHTGARSILGKYQKQELSRQRVHGGYNRNEKFIGHKAKQIRSDPCSCIPKSAGMLKRVSKVLIKKPRTKHAKKPLRMNISSYDRMSQENGTKRDNYHKLAHYKKEMGMGETVRKSVTKIKERKIKIEAGVKKSIENIENKVKGAVSASFRKFVQKAKEKYGRDLKTAELVELFESTFGVDLNLKDSLSEDNADIIRKEILEKWACAFECDAEECKPAECFQKKKQSIRKKRLKNDQGGIEKNQSTAPVVSRDRGIKAKYEEVGVNVGTINQNISSDNINSKTGVMKQQNVKSGRKGKASHHEAIQIKVKGKSKRAGHMCTCDSTGSRAVVKTKSVMSASISPSESTRRAVQSLPKTKTAKQRTSLKTINHLTQPKNNFQTLAPTDKQKLPQATETQRPLTLTKQRIQAKGVPKRHKPTKKKSSDDNIIDENTSKSQRQVVRIGSSFSFNIEFYKNKPVPDTAGVAKRNKVRRKHRETMSDIKRSRQKTSSTSQSVGKDAKSQARGYDLKRCFCTLKLKPKTIKAKTNKARLRKTNKSATKSLQTTKFKKNVPPLPMLLPYECEPMFCVPGECDPIKCEKIIKQRTTKHRSVHTDTQYLSRHSKSTPSLTSKTVFIGEEKKLSFNMPKPVDVKNTTYREIDHFKGDSPKRQVVRIGSTFSFNIEFYKGNPGNSAFNATNALSLPREDTFKIEKKGKGDTKKLQNKAIRQSKVYLVHKSSQISSRSVKSKHTFTKYSLRRCVCTLKFSNKLGSNISKAAKLTKGTLTSDYTYQASKAHHVVVDKATEKKDKNRFVAKILPYECEPGICIPGECNPYECQRIINNRSIKHKVKKTGTENRATKSTYSMMKKPLIYSKTKEVQSVLLTPKKEARQKLKITQPRSQYSSIRPSRNVVQMGSNFSFDIEFFKEKSPSKLKSSEYPERRKSINKIPQHPRRNTPTREHGSQQLDNRNQKSSLAKVENKDKGLYINSAIKRCFCTLRLNKLGKIKTPRQKSIGGLETKVNKEIKYQSLKNNYMKEKGMLNKNELKRQYYNYFFVPEQCDPYHHFERIKIREKFMSQEFGITSGKHQINSMLRSPSISITKITNAHTLSNYEIERNGQNKIRRCSRLIYTTNSDTIVTIKNNFQLLKSKEDSAFVVPPKGREPQSMVLEKFNKTSGILYLLKRCFCTLKLPKNNKTNKDIVNVLNPKPIEATIMPAQVFYKKDMIKSKENKELLAKYTKINYLHSKSSNLLFSSTAHKSGCDRLGADRIANEISESDALTINHRNKNMLEINPFSSSFYAMNLQVQNVRKNKYNLEPYECEPGVCVPGQCDPIECQKRIMRRLMRKASTMTSTDKRSTSMSCDTTCSKSRKQQFGQQIKYMQEAEKPKIASERHGLKYKSYPKSQNQGVRIGSTFKFNIEFSKDKTDMSHPAESKRKKRKSSLVSTGTTGKERYSKTKGTRDYKIRNQDRDSQSVSTMHDKGSGMTSKYKRCFCTLKLQKNTINFTTKEPPANVIQFTNRGQKTKKVKGEYNINNLEPYECEPNVCVTGECDPYACLERIKKRNKEICSRACGLGAECRNICASSMTANISKLSKGTYAQHNQKVRAPVKQSTVKQKNQILSQFASPVRNAVKIGSNFSFSVEFFKNKDGRNDYIETERMPKGKTRPRMVSRDTASLKMSTKSKCLSKACLFNTRESQVDAVKKEHRASGMRTILKRCFCTLALREKKTKHIERPKPKEIDTVSVGTKTPHVKVIPNVKDAYNKSKPYKIEPYECEPGVCIPGQCDPYQCEKLIRKRLRRDSGTLTQRYQARSAAIDTNRRKRLKDKVAQSIETTDKQPVKRERAIAPVSRKQADSSKQAVKISSTFSFNLEFYKDRSDGDFTSRHNLSSHALKNKKVQEMMEPKLMKGKCVTSCGAKPIHRQSQFDRHNMVSKGSGYGPLLKRCFCTLNLQKVGTNRHKKPIMKPTLNSNYTSVTTQSKRKYKPNHEQLYRETGTKARKMYSNLEPYECEPGTCIPGSCDPLECYERIKQRNLRTFGTVTGRAPTKSVCSVAEECRSQMKRKVQTQMDEPAPKSYPSRIVEEPRFPLISPNYWQGLKIGSDISCNIEFYKERLFPNGVSISDRHNANAKALHAHNKNVEMNYCPKWECKYSNTQCDLKDCHMQAKQTTESKASATGKVLKRCFCTAKLFQTDEGIRRKQLLTVGRLDKIQEISPFKLNQYSQNTKELLSCLNYRTKLVDRVVNKKYPDRTNSLQKEMKQMKNKENKNKTFNHSAAKSVTCTGKQRLSIFNFFAKMFERGHKNEHLSNEYTKDLTCDKFVNAVSVNHSCAVNYSDTKRNINTRNILHSRCHTKHKHIPTDIILPDNKSYKKKTGEASYLVNPEKQKHTPAYFKHGRSFNDNLKKYKSPCAQTNFIVQYQTENVLCNSCKYCDCISKYEKLTGPEVSERTDNRLVQVNPKYFEPVNQQQNNVNAMTMMNKSAGIDFKVDQNIKKSRKKVKYKGITKMSSSCIECETEKDKCSYFDKVKKICGVKGQKKNGNRGTKVNPKYLEPIPHQTNMKLKAVAKNKGIKANIIKSTQLTKTPPILKISGNDVIKDVCLIYDSDSGEETAIVQVVGTDIDLNFNQDKYIAGQKVKNVKKKINEKSSYVNKGKIRDVNKKSKDKDKNFVKIIKKSIKRNKAGSQVLIASATTPLCSCDIVKDKGKFRGKSIDIQNTNDMETLLPYAPKKYHKNETETAVNQNFNDYDYYCTTCICRGVPCQQFQANQNLTSKKRKKNILKKSKSEKRPEIPSSEIKTSKSAKVTKSQAKIQNTKRFKGKQRYFPLPPQKQRTPKLLIERKILCDCQELNKTRQNKTVTFTLPPEVKMDGTRVAFCKNAKCLQKQVPQKTKDDKIQKVKSKSSLLNSVSSYFKKYKPRSVMKKSSEGYTVVKISGNELTEDICSPIDSKKPTIVTVAGNAVINSSLKSSQKLSQRQNKKPNKSYMSNTPCKGTCLHCKSVSPSKENTKNAIPYLNKITTLCNKFQDGSCSCRICKCQSNIALTSKTAKKNEIGKKQKCVCGSKMCAKESKTKKPVKEAIKLRNTKPCVCGSPACKSLARIANTNTAKLLKDFFCEYHNRVCQCDNKECECAEMLKLAIKTAKNRKIRMEREKREQIALRKRKKQYSKADDKRRKQRLAGGKRMVKHIQSQKDSGDLYLLADAVVDVVRLGFTTTLDVLRSVYRVVTDPRNTLHVLKTMVTKPKQGLGIIKRAILDSGFISTIKRIILRFSVMSHVRTTKNMLETYGPTNYILHAADNNPKKKLKPRKKKIRKREPMDFSCSLYMASLRKRPCLSVYYTCPWFYPHCISLLTAWRQVTDIIMFLLAVVVWSPCILTMELCRGLMCCMLCGQS